MKARKKPKPVKAWALLDSKGRFVKGDIRGTLTYFAAPTRAGAKYYKLDTDKIVRVTITVSP